jgi:hypothetical protein
VGAEPGNDIIDVFDGKHDATSSVLGGALFGLALSAVGVVVDDLAAAVAFFKELGAAASTTFRD